MLPKKSNFAKDKCFGELKILLILDIINDIQQ